MLASKPARPWGLVTAQPHEHLVHVRGGRVVAATQGGRAWLWPGDAAALVDTSVQRLQFTADQVTREKVGVQVTGLAVFRVVAPLVAWPMLDLAHPERVEEILREMFVGATRRLVANLPLEDCLTRRKDALAAELLGEIGPVVGGHGSPGDATDRGWGLALDSLEIQDVRVLSKEVFERLQAPYRARLALEAVHAHAEVEQAETAVREEEARRAEAHRREMFELERARILAERTRHQEGQDHEHAAARRAQEAQVERKRAAAEAEREDAEATAESTVRVAEREAEAVRLRASAEAERLRLERAAVDQVSDARLREILLTQTIPEAAKGLRGMVGEVRVQPSELAILGEWLGKTLGQLRLESDTSK